MPPPSEHSGGGGGEGWDIGLGEWVGVFIVTSEFVTRPEKKKQARKGTHTHILYGCLSLKAVDFSVASKKKRLPLFQTTSIFPPSAPERFISNLTRCLSDFIVFFSTGAFFFQPWRFFQPHGMGNGSVFFQLCDFRKPKTPKT